MLTLLSIQNIVLIEQLQLDFKEGMSVLTGETGAGKSILLDSVSLCLGARGDASLVRQGADKGQVSAVFDVSQQGENFQNLLEDLGVPDEGNEIILRRIQNSDGRSRAFINDQPVSLSALKQVGSLLVELHGQHDDRAMMDPVTHRKLLDAFGGHHEDLEKISALYKEMKKAQKALTQHEILLKKQEEEREYNLHALDELNKLGPMEGEEAELAATRIRFMNAAKMKSDLEDAQNILENSGGAIPQISSQMRKLEKKAQIDDPVLTPILNALDAALLQLDEAATLVNAALYENGFSQSELEDIEERLFALRAAARKYECHVDELPQKLSFFENEAQSLEKGEELLIDLQQSAKQSQQAYEEYAKILSDKRQKAAHELDESIAKELTPLKLEHAKFQTRVESVFSQDEYIPELKDFDETGCDNVEFWAQTNPGSRPGPLLKIASGGELSRFMLALKVSLADKGSAPVLIFDEIDTGVGGAVASAMGARLERLGKKVQVLTVTHAPQVAALADTHMHIQKAAHTNSNQIELVTNVRMLNHQERIEELARMLSGESITEAARQAAISLLSHKNAEA